MRTTIQRSRGRQAKSSNRNTAQDDLCDVHFVDEKRVKRVQRKMKSPEAMTQLAETFKVFGDPTRVAIGWALLHEELCVCDLARLLGMSQSAVSHSLRALRQLRIVKFRKVGRIAYYTLDDDHVESLLAEGFRHLAEKG
jgi:DNA-binding transcriptional ArsR family regulator